MGDVRTTAEEPYDADSVAALIVTEEGRYLLQRRDDRAGVDFPGAWGLFGGAPEPGESLETAIRRELLEELKASPRTLVPFAALVFDERSYGGWYCRRHFFEVQASTDEVRAFELGEGQEMLLFSPDEASALGTRMIPYDICAVLMHARRDDSRATRPSTGRASMGGLR